MSPSRTLAECALVCGRMLALPPPNPKLVGLTGGSSSVAPSPRCDGDVDEARVILGDLQKLPHRYRGRERRAEHGQGCAGGCEFQCTEPDRRCRHDRVRQYHCCETVAPKIGSPTTNRRLAVPARHVLGRTVRPVKRPRRNDLSRRPATESREWMVAIWAQRCVEGTRQDRRSIRVTRQSLTHGSTRTSAGGVGF